MFRTIFTAIFSVLFFHTAFAGEVQQQMVDDLTYLHNVFGLKYAPLQFKKEYFGYDLDENVAKLKQKVFRNKEIQTEDFQQILTQFFRSLHDGHVGVAFCLTECASLPFLLKNFNGHYFVVDVEDEAAFLLNIGDEVVTINGVPVKDVVAQLQREMYGTTDIDIERCFAEMQLTFRCACEGISVPRGRVQIEVKRLQTIAPVVLEWSYCPEKVTHGAYPQILEKIWEVNQPVFKQYPLLLKRKVFPKYLFQKHCAETAQVKSGGSLLPMGYKRGRFFSSKNIVWKSPDQCPFEACLFKEAERTYAYLRIPDFLGDDDEAKTFSLLLERFQELSDGLIIDVADNPGGYDFYMYSLLSCLTDTPLIVPKEQCTLTQQDALDAVYMLELFDYLEENYFDAEDFFGSTILGYPVDQVFVDSLKKWCHFILAEWKAGKTLSDFFPPHGFAEILPHPRVCYTKPILVHVNELSCSCGDFFPAILQDNQCATIIGTKTAGLGGAVEMESFPNRFGVAGFSVTTSLAKRIDDTFIENMGVLPDVHLKFTASTLEGILEERDALLIQTLDNLYTNNLKNWEFGKADARSLIQQSSAEAAQLE